MPWARPKRKINSKLSWHSLFWLPSAYVVPGPVIRSEPQLWPQLQQCRILNPLCKARDWTCVPALPRHCQSILLHHSGNSTTFTLSNFSSVLVFLVLCLNKFYSTHYEDYSCFLLRVCSFRFYIQDYHPIWVIFVCGLRKRSIFTLLHLDIQLSQHYLVKWLHFLHWTVLASLLKWLDHSVKFYLPCRQFIADSSYFFHYLFWQSI